MNKYFLIALILLFSSCYNTERNCTSFKNGSFEFSYTINANGDKIIGKIIRDHDLQVEYFNNKIDSSSVRWINDCEFIAKSIRPKSKKDESSVHIKILTTTKDSYIFEYYIVGNEKNKQRGLAKKIN